jgi:molecular chaperone GrpE
MDEKDHPREEESEDTEVKESDIKGDQSEGDEKDKEIAELHSKLQYLQAEYENFKKRTSKDLEAVVRFGNEGLVKKLLPMLDDFEVCLEAVEDEGIRKGFELLHGNLLKTLKDEGLEEIRALGEGFDPFRHEAVLEADDPDREENEVAEVLQKGYIFKSKVIRPSKVKVVRHHEEEDKEAGENG